VSAREPPASGRARQLLACWKALERCALAAAAAHPALPRSPGGLDACKGGCRARANVSAGQEMEARR
jgi:hypothetical protein